MNKLELMIGHQLDQATLDNLLLPSPLKSTPLLTNIKLQNGNRELTEIDKGDRTTKQGNKTCT